MIVKCSQCQTRFRVPDEKVTERGLRVRCAKCQNTFRVTKDMDALGAFAPTDAGNPVPPINPEPPTSDADAFGLKIGGSVLDPSPNPFESFGDATVDPFGEKTRVAIRYPAEALDAAAEGADSPGPTAPMTIPSPMPASAESTVPSRLQMHELFAQVNGHLAEEDPAHVGIEPERPMFGAPPVESYREDFSGLGLPGEAPPAPMEFSEEIVSTKADGKPLARIALTSSRGKGTAEREARRSLSSSQVPSTALVPHGPSSLVRSIAALALGVGLLALGLSSLDGDETRGASGKAGGESGFEVVSVNNGLYPTQAGTSVFLVRGEVENRTGASARVRVVAELLDGGAVMQASRVSAGVVPSPEELHQLLGAEDLATLQAKLGERAQAIGPGQRAPFLVAFPQFPPDLARYRLRMKVENDASQAMAAP